MKLIERHEYIDRLKRLRGTPDIKIITGLRRSGKSELLRAYARWLQSENPDINIISIDFANLSFDNLKEYKALYAYVEADYREGAENVVMVDEVQMCNSFELAINSFHNSCRYDIYLSIYLTGSNAFLLSSDLATLFTGRFIDIPLYPFSFAEYCQYYEVNDHFEIALQDYLSEGGIAGSYVYKDERDRRSYIKDAYESLVKRDLTDKYRIKEVALLDTLTEFLMDNISNLSTTNNVSNVLKNNKVETNHVSVGNYIKYLCNVFMFYKVKRYDIRGKKYLETNEKYYLVDLAFRYSLLGKRNMDYGRAYENIVALELMRRGYTIYVGKLYQKEVDFVAMRGDEKCYIQVSDNISDLHTLTRELEPLKAIRDDYPKMILANTRHEAYDIDGIRVIDIAEWLLAKS